MRNEFKQFITVLALSIALICAGYLSGRAQTTQTAQNTVKTTCKGVKADKTACKSTFIVKGSEFCASHNPEAIKCAGLNSKKQPCGMTVKTKGEFCRHHSNTNL
jgi:hypothetical protein